MCRHMESPGTDDFLTRRFVCVLIVHIYDFDSHCAMSHFLIKFPANWRVTPLYPLCQSQFLFAFGSFLCINFGPWEQLPFVEQCATPMLADVPKTHTHNEFKSTDLIYIPAHII